MSKLVILAALLGVLSLAGCAQAPLTKADVDGRIICNFEYMDQVERQARRLFAQIQWVNCPTITLRTT